MRDEKRAAASRLAPKAGDPQATRRAWVAPQARRLVTSAAEAGGDTSTDGLEILS